jgi:hypothetical protein
MTKLMRKQRKKIPKIKDVARKDLVESKANQKLSSSGKALQTMINHLHKLLRLISVITLFIECQQDVDSFQSLLQRKASVELRIKHRLANI